MEGSTMAGSSPAGESPRMPTSGRGLGPYRFGLIATRKAGHSSS